MPSCLRPPSVALKAKKVVSVVGEKKGLPAGGIENLNRFREVPLLVLAESRFQGDQPSGFAGSLRCTEFGRGLGATLTLPFHAIELFRVLICRGRSTR